MKKLLFFLLLMASTAYAVPESKVSGPDDIFGGAGCTTDCTFDNVSTGTLTAGRIDAGLGVFGNITAGYMRMPSGAAASRPSLCFGDCDTGFFESSDDSLAFAVNSLLKVSLNLGYMFGSGNGSFTIPHSQLASATIPIYTFSADLDTGINRAGADQLSHIAGGKEAMRNYSTFSQFYPTTGGYLQVNGGLFTAFRNLSSATETLTFKDHTIFCLANDNEVVATMPLCSGVAYSQQLMVVYTDSGSTNKCKLDGDGAETVAGFAVYSGLDTFEEGCHFACDGAGNWWRVGCF